MEFFKATKEDVLTLEASNYGKITWHFGCSIRSKKIQFLESYLRQTS
jgi:hypothetical protein